MRRGTKGMRPLNDRRCTCASMAESGSEILPNVFAPEEFFKSYKGSGDAV